MSLAFVPPPSLSHTRGVSLIGVILCRFYFAPLWGPGDGRAALSAVARNSHDEPALVEGKENLTACALACHTRHGARCAADCLDRPSCSCVLRFIPHRPSAPDHPHSSPTSTAAEAMKRGEVGWGRGQHESTAQSCQAR
jgi:hypothetical protein